MGAGVGANARTSTGAVDCADASDGTGASSSAGACTIKKELSLVKPSSLDYAFECIDCLTVRLKVLSARTCACSCINGIFHGLD